MNNNTKLKLLQTAVETNKSEYDSSLAARKALMLSMRDTGSSNADLAGITGLSVNSVRRMCNKSNDVAFSDAAIDRIAADIEITTIDNTDQWKARQIKQIEEEPTFVWIKTLVSVAVTCFAILCYLEYVA